MKSIAKKPTIKPTVVVVLLLMLIIGGYIGVAAKTKLWPFVPSISPQASAPASKNDGTSKSKTTIASGQELKTSDQVPVSSALSAQITQLSEDDKGNIIFSASVYNSATQGICVVTFTNSNDKPYVQQIDSTIKGGVNLCGPINISSLNFSYLGTWNVSLRFYNNGAQAVATSTIDIK